MGNSRSRQDHRDLVTVMCYSRELERLLKLYFLPEDQYQRYSLGNVQYGYASTVMDLFNSMVALEPNRVVL